MKRQVGPESEAAVDNFLLDLGGAAENTRRMIAEYNTGGRWSGRDRDIIVSGSDDHTVRVWDAVSGDPLVAPLAGHDGPVYAVAIGRPGTATSSSQAPTIAPY